MVLLFQPYKVKLSAFQISKIEKTLPSHHTNQCPLVFSEREGLKGLLITDVTF